MCLRGGEMHRAITTDQAQSALMLLSAAINMLETGCEFKLIPADLPWVLVILELMPQMPLQDGR